MLCSLCKCFRATFVPCPAPQRAARAMSCPMPGRSPHPAHLWGNSSTRHLSPPLTETRPWKSKIEHPALPKPLSWEGCGTAREKRQKMGLFGGSCVDGNGSTFCSLVSVPGLGTLQGSPRPWWAREQSRGSPASRTLALKVLLLLLGPKQPLRDQKNLFGHLQYPQRQMSGGDHDGAKLMNIPFLLLIFPKQI